MKSAIFWLLIGALLFCIPVVLSELPEPVVTAFVSAAPVMDAASFDAPALERSQPRGPPV